MNESPLDRNLPPSDPRSMVTPSPWTCFATAVQFLTRLPIALPAGKSSTFYALAFRHSLVFYPAVGGLIGLVTAIVFCALLFLGVTPWIAAFVAVGAEAMLTGALHEDGFADTCDALGGCWSRDRALEILRDSRLGTYGTLALVLGVGARVAALATLGHFGYLWSLVAIVAAGSLSRLAILALVATTSPVADRVSQANAVAGAVTRSSFVRSMLWSAPLWGSWIIIDASVAWTSIGFAALTWFGYRRMIVRRLGGTTGDLLGGCAFVTQLMLTIGATLR